MMKKAMELVKNEITKERFLSANGIKDVKKYVVQGLIKAKENQDKKLLDDVIFVVFKFRVYDASLLSCLHELMLSKWHCNHEEIASILQHISDETSLPVLFEAIELHLDYLAWDENYAFEVRCVRAIYYIGEEKSRAYLEKLRTHSNPIISAMAQRQFNKLED